MKITNIKSICKEKKMKKKIMIFMFSLKGGGAERTIVNIINHLDEEKFDVIFVLGTDADSDYLELLKDSIKIIVLNCRKPKYSIFKLRNCIKKEKPDVLFSTVNKNNIVLLLAKILSFRKIPTVIREASHRTQSGKVTNKNKLLTRVLYNLFSSKIVALSEGVREDLITNFKISEKKTKVIYNPVDINYIKSSMNEEIQDSFNLKSDEKIIIAVGRLAKVKDFPTLIKAFEIVLKDVNARLFILGRGPLESELKQLSKQLNISDKIEFLGFQKNPYKYIKQADVFVLSSKWEGFAHVIVEAMTIGTPVISTNCKSGPAEIIGDNEYGILVPVQDYKLMAEQIILLFKNDNMGNNYANLGIERSYTFEARKITKKYEDLFMQSMK